jgi:hypothetical protein
MTKIEMCTELSNDYADRASRGGANYEDAYEHYLSRCLNRDTEELTKQCKIQGLKPPTDVKKP